MNRIRIIIPYFGKLPDTFPFWYNSALDNQDVEGGCDLNYTPNKGIEKNINYAASGSLGFGGHNVCVALRPIK